MDSPVLVDFSAGVSASGDATSLPTRPNPPRFRLSGTASSRARTRARPNRHPADAASLV